MQPSTASEDIEMISRPHQEVRETTDLTEGIIKLMGGLALDEEKSDFRILVSAWIVSSEKEYKSSIDYNREVAEKVIGHAPSTGADWESILLRMYGEDQLKYLLADKTVVQIESSKFPQADERPVSDQEKIFDWLQRSEAGFLRYAPTIDWSEVCYNHQLQERPLDEHIAMGVGTKYAVILGKAPKERTWSVYSADLLDCAYPVFANNLEAAKFEVVVKQVGLAKALKERLQGSVYSYDRSTLSLQDVPDSGFVSGDHLVLNWPNSDTQYGTKDKICVYTLPHCYTTDGQTQSGDAKTWYYELLVPQMSISSVCLLFPYMMFVTNTSLFNHLSALKCMTNYADVWQSLATSCSKALGQTGRCDLIVIIELEKKAIFKVVPILEGNVTHLSVYPRMTCPSDLLIDKKEYKVFFNVMNASSPEMHGRTASFYLFPELRGGSTADAAIEAGFYWSDPEKELHHAEIVGSQHTSPAIEKPRGIYQFPGGHIVQLSEHNLSTFVAKTVNGIFPTDSLYHARDVSSTDCAVYANLHITLTGSGDVQFACLRMGEGDLVPRYTFTERHLAIMGRKPPASAKSLSLKSKNTGVNVGHYKAIWVSPSLRVVVQLNNGTLVSFRPKNLPELKEYLEEVAKAQALELSQRYAKVMTERQHNEATAYGVEPEALKMAKEDSKKNSQ